MITESRRAVNPFFSYCLHMLFSPTDKKIDHVPIKRVKVKQEFGDNAKIAAASTANRPKYISIFICCICTYDISTCQYNFNFCNRVTCEPISTARNAPASTLYKSTHENRSAGTARDHKVF